MRTVVVVTSLLLAGVALRVSSSATAAPDPSATRVRADVEFLGDDLLEGRNTGSRAFEIAARFAATELEAAGWAPGADDGTYFQRVPFVESTLQSSSLELTAGGTTTPILVPDEGLAPPSATRDEARVSAPVVFAGFGVTAPEFDYDDYAGLDVQGKIVAIRANAPPRFPSEPRAHYASPQNKLKNAADHGAVAVVTLLGPDDEARYPWARMKDYAAHPSFAWTDADGSPGAVEGRLQATAYLNQTASARLFAGAPLTFDEAVEKGRQSQPGGVALPASLTIATTTSHRAVTSPNVVAVLKGSDPTLAATSVVLTAHLDHIGVKETGDGDRINNGVYDNAIGSAIALEVSRALAALRGRPKRSVVTVLLTGEEKGLLGSDYFTRHLPGAAGRPVADVNLDMAVFLFATKDLVAFGADNSTLDTVVRRAAAGVGLTVGPDPMPEQNIFVRSDQYSFVKRGIPAVYLMPGFTASDPAVKGPEVFRRFLESNYHQPSDDLSLPMDLPSIARFTRLNLAVVRDIADDPTAPAWKPGNFFGRTFGGTD